MLVDLHPVTLKQITPPQLLEWKPNVWLELKKILPPANDYIFSQGGYYFAMCITDQGFPSIKIQDMLGVSKYLRFTCLQDSLVSEILTELVCSKALDPKTLLEGLKATFMAFLELYSNLSKFQVEANNLAKEYICEK